MKKVRDREMTRRTDRSKKTEAQNTEYESNAKRTMMLIADVEYVLSLDLKKNENKKTSTHQELSICPVLLDTRRF